MTPEEFLKRLDNVAETGANRWTARCPAHDDRKNSLCVGVADDGKILVHCQANCATADVLRVVDCQIRDLFPAGKTSVLTNQRKAAVAEYNYHDEHGNLLYQTVRMEPKDFRQRAPKDGGGWTWSTKSIRRVLYRLPELLTADVATTVYVVEGEKDADALAALGLVATTNVCGAGKWRREYSQVLSGRTVVILPDHDQSGRDHAVQVACSLAGSAASIKIVALPNLPDKGDVSDWLAAGGTRDALLQLVDTVPEHSNEHGTRGPTAAAGDQAKGSQATRLLAAIEAHSELFHDPDGDGYATLTLGNHCETYKIRSKAFRRQLAGWFYRAHQTAPNLQALNDAVEVLDGRAAFEGPEHPVHVRLAALGQAIYLDLGDQDWRAVEVDAHGWRVVAPPVKFRRPKAMLPLPVPQPGGTLGDLRQFINLGDSDWALAAGWLVAAVRPSGPYPVLCLHGEQGSAKSTASRILRRLLDPNSADLRAEPREPRDLMVAANNGWMIALDNLSFVPSWLSDALCRLATGGGFSTRTLFTDGDETIFAAQRPVILNGIEEVAVRGDLLDRSLIVSLPLIPEHLRRSEAELWAAFEQERPKLLGALLTVASTAIANLPTTNLTSLPRMADFALLAAAAEPAMGLSVPFSVAYMGNREDAHRLALEASPAGKAIVELIEVRLDWEGVASDLLADLEASAGLTERKQKPKGWPGNGRALSCTLKRLAPNLRAVGIDVEFGHRSKHLRPLRLRKVDGRAACVTQTAACVTQAAACVTQAAACVIPDGFTSPENPANVGHSDEDDAGDANSLADSNLQPAVPSATKRVKLRI